MLTVIAQPTESAVPSCKNASLPDFLAALRRSRVLTRRRLAEVSERVLDGRFPAESLALARRLVRQGWLTEYQARRILHSPENPRAGDRPLYDPRTDRLGARWAGSTGSDIASWAGSWRR